jgi:hypothetical protein
VGLERPERLGRDPIRLISTSGLRSHIAPDIHPLVTFEPNSCVLAGRAITSLASHAALPRFSRILNLNCPPRSPFWNAPQTPGD